VREGFHKSAKGLTRKHTAGLIEVAHTLKPTLRHQRGYLMAYGMLAFGNPAISPGLSTIVSGLFPYVAEVERGTTMVDFHAGT